MSLILPKHLYSVTTGGNLATDKDEGQAETVLGGAEGAERDTD